MPNNPLGPRPGGTFSALNVSATTNILGPQSQVPMTLYRVSVTTAGSGAGAVNDNNSTSSGNTAANEIGVIPNTVGVYEFIWPVKTGIVFVPGSGQIASISFA